MWFLFIINMVFWSFPSPPLTDYVVCVFIPPSSSSLNQCFNMSILPSIIFVYLPGNSASGPQVEAFKDFLRLDLKFKKIFYWNTGCLKWNPPFWNEYYSSIVQLGQKIKLNPSMGQKQYLKSCFRIRIFWKLCPVGGSDYQNLVKNWRMFLNLSPT